MQNHYTGPSGSKKVAISRLPRGAPILPNPADKPREDRVTKACILCRRRKVRCSGELPRCSNCQVSDAECVYGQARRDRLKESMQLNQTLATLLKDLSDRVGEKDRKSIHQALEEAEDDLFIENPVPSVTSGRTRKQSPTEEDDANRHHGEAFVTGSVGSNENAHFLGEDLLRSRESRETGYIGQNSEVQWLRSVQRQSGRGNTDPVGQPYGPPGAGQDAIDERSSALYERRERSVPGRMGHITDASFYLDSDDMEVDIAVDPYDLPEPKVAVQLFNCYMETVHTSFPLMPIPFEGQFLRFIEAVKQNKPYQVPEKWRATMNLVFAIGAKYSHLIGAEWRGNDRDDLVYMTRAIHLLGLRNTVMIISGPDLGLVQATGTLALYFLVIGHVSRAWVMIGISIRLALALGLHLRNEDPSADFTKRGTLARTWWGLHMIECLVSSITGRPPVLSTEDCTVVLPLCLVNQQQGNGRPEQASRTRRSQSSPQTSASSKTFDSAVKKANEAWYIDTSIRLSIISQKVLSSLYSPRIAVHSWEHIQTRIKELLSDLEDWAKLALPKIQASVPNVRKTFEDRHEFLLQIDYWSTKILITRPCLCRIEGRIRRESETSVNFNAKAAETCVEAARAITNLFPDQPDVLFIYSQGPWWNVIHIIMQSTAVLLLEMAYQQKHINNEDNETIGSIKKMIRWLRAMQIHDPVAARAYNVLWKILKNCAPSLQSKADELLAEEVESQQTSSSSHHYQTPAEQYVPDSWPTMDYVYGQTEQQTVFDHQPFQVPDPLPEIGSASYPYHSSFEQYQTPMAFGNAFHSNFDQGAPFMNMQDLWTSTSPPGVPNTGFGNMPFQQEDMQNHATQQTQHNVQQNRQLEHNDQSSDTRYAPFQ